VIILGSLAVHVSSSNCSDKAEQFYVNLIYGICIIGAFVSIGSLVSISAALIEIYLIKRRFNEHYPESIRLAPWLPHLTGSTILHILGHAANTFGPIVVVFAWGYLAFKIYERCH
jgi:hypothetical protein